MKRKIIILFPNIHLSYSPTVLSLYDLLSEHFDVAIISPSPKNFDNKPLTHIKVKYLEELKGFVQYRINELLYFLSALLHKDFSVLRKNKINVETFYEYSLIKKYISANQPDIIIAVDFKSLWYAELLGKNAEFLSLEIDEDNQFYQLCGKQNVNSVVIQTKNRYEYLFKDREFKTFLIQNSPVFKSFDNDTKTRKGLVYCGTAWREFGFYHCLDFIKEFPEYSLTVRGAVVGGSKEKIENEYADEVSDKRLIINDVYLDNADLLRYLRQFRIGFCFYNFEVESMRKFNYISAPSGKMFTYFAAGVPVIGIDIIGLAPVREFDCGVLIKDLSPQSIKQAIDKIEENFDYYSENCLNAATHYSFDKAAQPFINYLLESCRKSH